MSHAMDVVAADNNRCGEAPIWDTDNKRLIWTDNAGDLVYDFTPATRKKRVICRKLMVAGITLTRGEELVFAGAAGLHIWRGQDDYRTLVSERDGERLSFNDIIADPKGRVYAGTLYWGAEGMEKHGKLYLIDTDGSVRVADEGIELANGLGFSPDDKTLYFADSSARRIYAYDVNAGTGELASKRVFVRVPDDEGIPDGLTVDRDGYVWCAQWYGSQIVRYDPQGAVERRIPMPVQQVSSVGFGGDDMTDLYVTTAGEAWPSRHMPPGFDPTAPNMGGSLYRIRLDIQGKPEHRAALPWR